MMYLTALATLASVLFYFYLIIGVARARGQYGVAAPATTGHPAFERLYRVQMNTLESMAIYLPCLWLFGFYVSDGGAALLAVVWIIGRFMYLRGYSEAAEKRGRGFMVQFAATAILFGGALVDILARIFLGD